MRKSMTFFQYIYYLKPWAQILLCVAGWTVWTVVMILLHRYKSIRIGAALLGLALSIVLILYQTVLARNGGVRSLILRPFAILAKAREEDEYYRSMVLNAILFVPLGLSLSVLLSQKLTPGKCVALTVLIGLLISAGLETLQYAFALGKTETDDVIMNTFGTFFGAAHIWVTAFAQRRLCTRESG
ncbi:MAG: VanZ family protein [Oscillospiraceae bacterium]|nr:VanZ family protein [Oscillospiraceae bacterium]